MKYFIGIAIHNKMRNEQPSANAIILKVLICLIFTVLPSFAQIKNNIRQLGLGQDFYNEDVQKACPARP
jgi:hypothetical protein